MLTIGETGKPVPKPTPDSAPYWEDAARGVLSIQRCRECERPYFYPRSACPRCGSEDVEWFEASGRGTLHSYLIVHAPAPGFADIAPHAIAVVELEEGPRMMTNIIGIENTPELLQLDMPLEVAFVPRGDQMLPVFAPAGRTS